MTSPTVYPADRRGEADVKLSSEGDDRRSPEQLASSEPSASSTSSSPRGDRGSANVGGIRWKSHLVIIGAYTLLALAAPVTKWLMMRGESIGMTHGNAISFCNLLFVGNLSAAWFAWVTTDRGAVKTAVGSIRNGVALSLMATAVLAVLAPALFFLAIEKTPVANVIVISRAGPILYALFGTLISRYRVTIWQWSGYGFIGVAIVMTLLIDTPDHGFRVGDGLAFAAAAAAAGMSLAGRRALDAMGLGPFVCLRNLLSSIGFAVIALSLFGPLHFADLVIPAVVGMIAIYGFVVVGGGQLLWFRSIQTASAQTIGSWSFISPLVAIATTMGLLSEEPPRAMFLALVIVVVGLLIASRHQTEPATVPSDATLAAQ